ncbi:MAG: carboxypeptidase regulatory-like domain-containing protein [Planctomycetes bacterium]|nr:carboxypeptidase regulatory-like domain-containing protein [Planctomycetota bacterium]
MDRLKLFVIAETAILAALATTWMLGRDPGASSASNALRSEPLSVRPAEPMNAGGGAVRVERSASAAESAGPREEIDAELGVGVCGTVRGAQGQFLAGASVSFVRDGTWLSARTAANGVYALGGLAPGSWLLRAGAEGHARIESPRQLVDAAWQTIDVDLSPWYAVRVRIDTKSGEPLGKGIEDQNWEAAPYVVATAEPLERDLPLTEHNRVPLFGVGQWKRAEDLSEPARSELGTGGYAGELYLDREPPVYASLLLRHLRLETQRIEPGQRELRFVLDPSDLESKLGSLRIRFVDPDSGAPLSGVRMRFASAQGVGGEKVSDADGRARMEHLMPGIGALDIGARDREVMELRVRVPSGAELDLGDLALSPRVICRGRVIDERGEPAMDTHVTWDNLDRRSWPAPLFDRRSAGQDAEGRFNIRVGRQRYVFHGRDRQGRRGYALLDARDGVAEEVVLRLQSAAHVRFRYDASECSGYLVVIHTPDGAPFHVVALDGSLLSRGVDLPPGSYIATTYDAADRIVKARPFTVGAETSELALP